MRTLRITGKAVLSERPDTFIINFPIQEICGDHIDAMERLNAKVERLRDILSNNNLDPKLLKTSSFSVGKEKKWNSKSDEYINLGYKASHSVSIELPLNQELMNNILLDLATQDLDIEFNIDFVLKDTKTLIERLIKNAIENAKENAELIATSTGVKLKEIINIDYSFNEIRFIHSDLDMCLLESSEISLPDIEPNDVEAEKTITITWSLE